MLNCVFTIGPDGNLALSDQPELEGATTERPSVDGLDKDVEYELRLKELEFQERLRTEEIELQRSELKEKKKSTKILKEHDSKTESEFRSLRRKMDRLEIDRQNERLRNQRPRLLPIPSL